MGSAIAQIVPLILVSAVLPAPIVIVLLLLRNERGLAIASAFVGGMTAVRLLQGGLFGIAFRDLGAGNGDDEAGAVEAVLLLVVGILLLVTALRVMLKEDDPDAPPPRWMGLIERVTPLRAFLFGAGLLIIAMKHWVLVLSAIAVIHDAEVSRAQGVVVFLIFVLGAQALLIAPLVATAVAPAGSAAVLRGASAWLERNNRPIKVGAAAIFGVYFVWSGVSGLLG